MLFHWALLISSSGRKMDLWLFLPTEKLVPLCWGSVELLLPTDVSSGEWEFEFGCGCCFRLKLPRAALLLLIILPDQAVDLGFASSCKMYMEQVDQHIPVWCSSWFSLQKSEGIFTCDTCWLWFCFLFSIISCWNFQE